MGYGILRLFIATASGCPYWDFYALWGQSSSTRRPRYRVCSEASLKFGGVLPVCAPSVAAHPSILLLCQACTDPERSARESCRLLLSVVANAERFTAVA